MCACVCNYRIMRGWMQVDLRLRFAIDVRGYIGFYCLTNVTLLYRSKMESGIVLPVCVCVCLFVSSSRKATKRSYKKASQQVSLTEFTSKRTDYYQPANSNAALIIGSASRADSAADGNIGALSTVLRAKEGAFCYANPFITLATVLLL